MNRVVTRSRSKTESDRRATGPGCALSPIVARCCTYVWYMYIHCAFPASLLGAARTLGRQKCATCQARFARKKNEKQKKLMPPPHPELCTTVIRYTVIRVRRESFLSSFFLRL